MKRDLTLSVVTAFVLLVLLTLQGASGLPGPPTATTTGLGSSSQGYPNTSWAVGVVVPEGAGMEGGGRLAWEEVSNITAEFTLPNVTLPDRVVYAVVSAMTADGVVLQAAAGVYPDSTVWFAYSWSIANFGSSTLNYVWVLNGTEPSMAPGAPVSVSIFRSADSWSLRIEDDATGASVVRTFPAGIGQLLKAGDQEVFALESYSRSAATFKGMGNLTLSSLEMDGSRLTSGAYPYSVWDPTRNPLFVVGSSGSSPPQFLSFGRAPDGSYVWEYEGVWQTTGDPFAVFEATIVLLAVIFGSVFGAVLWATRKPSRRF